MKLIHTKILKVVITPINYILSLPFEKKKKNYILLQMLMQVGRRNFKIFRPKVSTQQKETLMQ